MEALRHPRFMILERFLAHPLQERGCLFVATGNPGSPVADQQ
jgi:hypothetical protein